MIKNLCTEKHVFYKFDNAIIYEKIVFLFFIFLQYKKYNNETVFNFFLNEHNRKYGNLLFSGNRSREETAYC